jgi:predicted neuraminidase
MSMYATLTLALLLASNAAALAGGLVKERLFGPEVPTGRYKHPACITGLENGDLFLVYYGGSGEYATDTGVFGSRYDHVSRKWSRPRLVASDPFRSVGNGVVWQAPGGVVWLFYVVRWGDTWSTSRVQAKISRDNAETWSESFVVSEREGMMVRGRPIVLSSGEYLLPAYHETGYDPEMVGPASAGWFLRWDAERRQWIESGQIRSKKGNIQPAAAEISPGHLVAYCRRGGGYGPVTDGYIVRSESLDGGRTWTKGQDSKFPNPNAAVDFIRLRSGNLMLVFNNSMTDRDPLTVALSADRDKSWPWVRDLATGPHDYAYPVAIQTKDGKIHVVYTSEQRTVVNQAVFDEGWIKAGK